jgi:hypothetical protein
MAHKRRLRDNASGRARNRSIAQLKIGAQSSAPSVLWRSSIGHLHRCQRKLPDLKCRLWTALLIGLPRVGERGSNPVQRAAIEPAI